MWDDTLRHRDRGPRRATGRPGHAGQGGALRGELPHPRDRARPAPPRGARDGGHRIHRERRRPPHHLRGHRHRRPGAVRRPARSRPSCGASDRRGGATPRTGSTTGGGSTSSGARTPGPGTGASSPKHLSVLRSESARLRPVRRGPVAVLRPRRRTGMAHRGHRPRGRPRPRPGHADMAVAPHRPYAQRHVVLRRRRRSAPRSLT